MKPNFDGLGIAMLGLFLPRFVMRWLGWELVNNEPREWKGITIERHGNWQRVK